MSCKNERGMEEACKGCDQSNDYCCKNKHWKICSCCKGYGTTDNPAFSNGITASEADELGEDFMDSYMSGEMDVACKCCNGSGKVLTCPEIEAYWQADYEMAFDSAAEAACGA
jgi:hypothetical protein